MDYAVRWPSFWRSAGFPPSLEAPASQRLLGCTVYPHLTGPLDLATAQLGCPILDLSYCGVCITGLLSVLGYCAAWMSYTGSELLRRLQYYLRPSVWRCTGWLPGLDRVFLCRPGSFIPWPYAATELMRVLHASDRYSNWILLSFWI